MEFYYHPILGLQYKSYLNDPLLVIDFKALQQIKYDIDMMMYYAKEQGIIFTSSGSRNTFLQLPNEQQIITNAY